MTWDGQYTAEMINGLRDGTWTRDATGQPVKSGTVQPYGLIETKTADQTGRLLSTFKSIDGKKHWMEPWKLAGQLQLFIDKTGTGEMGRRFKAQRMAEFEAAGMLTDDGKVKLTW